MSDIAFKSCKLACAAALAALFAGAGSASAAVTGAEAHAAQPSMSTYCPYTEVFTGKIQSNASGVVTYHWAGSDHVDGPTMTITFDKPGSMAVPSYSRSFGVNKYTAQSFKGDELIHITSPSDWVSGKADYTLTCNIFIP